MTGKLSAGILLFRGRGGALEVFLVHPGGPFWAKKDEGAWTVPKGEPEEGEALLDTALREFCEEVGFRPEGPYLELPPVKQAGGKVVHCWMAEGDCDPSCLTGHSFEMEWPPRSGKRQQFPEVDRAAWFTPQEARRRINKAQAAFLDRLHERLERADNSGIENVGSEPAH